MGQTSIIDHDLLINSILSEGGTIVGGYVRAWVSAGKPSNEGWEDIDCIFPNLDQANKAINNLKNLFGTNAPEIDLRPSAFGDFSLFKQNKLSSLQFNTFYCSCWAYDGEIKVLEPAKSHKSFEEILNQTQNKIAQCILPFYFYKKNPRQLSKMVKYGWKVIDFQGEEIPQENLLKIIKSFKSVFTPHNKKD